jgi:hypothetical protein
MELHDFVLRSVIFSMLYTMECWEIQHLEMFAQARLAVLFVG